jgi:hypothetical protein
MPGLEGIMASIKIPREMASPVKTVIPEGFPSGITSRKQSKPNKSEVIGPANKI